MRRAGFEIYFCVIFGIITPHNPLEYRRLVWVSAFVGFVNENRMTTATSNNTGGGSSILGSSASDNMTDMFKSELDTVEQFHRTLNRPNLTQEELLDEYRALGLRYENLLKQAATLTRIGDVAQRKLINTKSQLAAQSEVINRANGELQEKNERLKESIEEINQLNMVLGNEQAKADALLLNILPPDIAARLKEGEDKIADYFEDATVVFTDIVGFTNLASLVSATTIVKLLNTLFSRFDALLDHHPVEKIKTIGDSYMVAAGIPTPRKDHALQAASFAFAMHNELRRFVAETGYPISMRIGIHSGPVVAGIIGTRKFVYDLWGDTVNIASRMESHGQPGKIHCSETVYEKLSNFYKFERRGAIDIKGKGKMDTYFLIGDIA
jgi:class 3 adenylate cyclase